MKRLKVLAFILLTLHVSGMSGLMTCFQNLADAHAHSNDHAHETIPDPETEQPANFHCTEAAFLITLSGKNTSTSADSYSAAWDPFENFTAASQAGKNRFVESPPPQPGGLPSYLLFSVLRI
jgi:hypothetical protein